MSSLYKPPGYIDYQEFFDKILDVLLERHPGQASFKEKILSGGFFEDVRFYRFSFYEFEERSLEELRQLLTDFESSRHKIIFFTYVTVQRQHLNPDNEYEVYTVYRGANSQFLFNSYEDGHYSVTEDIGKHQIEHGDNYHLERCHQEKEGVVVSHHKLVIVPCLCERTIMDQSYGREHFLTLFYASRVWKLMRDGLCTSVEAVLSTKPDEPLPKTHWAQNKGWYTLLIGRRIRDAGRETQYVFKEKDVLKYCQELPLGGLYGQSRQDVSLRDLYQRECEKTGDLEKKLKETTLKMREAVNKYKGLVKRFNRLLKGFFAVYFAYQNKVHKHHKDVGNPEDIKEINSEKLSILLSTGGDSSANAKTMETYKQRYLNKENMDLFLEDDEDPS